VGVVVAGTGVVATAGGVVLMVALGISMPIDFDNSRNLFQGLVEILSLAESKSIIETEFRELLDEIYLP
jgi:TPP-dependent indolepyruvate ferredoxin oxidoreductase alpha subunit